MSAAPSRPRDFLALARGLAADGAWEQLRAALDSRRERTASHPELDLLLAEAKLRLGDPTGARVLIAATIPRLERMGDASCLRRAVNLLGAAHFELGDLADAEAAFGRALELANGDGDALMVARATNNLGLISNIRGNHEAALGSYQLAVAAFQQVGHTLGLAEATHNMAITYRDVRRYDQADKYERRAIELAREAGSGRLLAMARVGRAELSLLQGEPQVAEAGARLAAADYARLPDPLGEADALRLMGRALGAIGEIRAALETLDRAVGMARMHESALLEAEALRDRAELRATFGRLGACEDAEAAVAIYDRLGATQEGAGLREWLRTLSQ